MNHTHEKLEPIIAQKRAQVLELYQGIAEDKNHVVGKIWQGDFEPETDNINRNILKAALSSSGLSVIAEIKRRSPSKGLIAAIADPVALAQRYIAGGAHALSVLTDKAFFGGDILDLSQVRDRVSRAVPIIRKDFIIDAIQIAEAKVRGADAVLCIVAVLGAETKKLVAYAQTLKLDVLVEIHDERELAIAIESGADMIGINNRNLHTFVVDTDNALRLVEKIPDYLIKVAESGITTPALAKQYHQAGFDAVLIGEALVRSLEPEQFIRECCNA